MKKEIICVKFKEGITSENADKILQNIYNYLKEDYFVVGVYENFINIEPISKNAKVLCIDGKQYSTQELLEVIEKAAEYDDLCS